MRGDDRILREIRFMSQLLTCLIPGGVNGASVFGLRYGLGHMDAGLGARPR